ncbi:hypothetical protein BE18_35365 [Sorangium cellulosum]|uniref:Uncharacterized protein n=1 Tax=Sorangium cellulosum TaxID=56 RepID=A0A150SHQ7_SORCE|nr:hypothetical protein BE18_35365 [Sorangium cellulosum]
MFLCMETTLLAPGSTSRERRGAGSQDAHGLTYQRDGGRGSSSGAQRGVARHRSWSRRGGSGGRVPRDLALCLIEGGIRPPSRRAFHLLEGEFDPPHAWPGI